jgi:hypothetical protein
VRGRNQWQRTFSRRPSNLNFIGYMTCIASGTVWVLAWLSIFSMPNPKWHIPTRTNRDIGILAISGCPTQLVTTRFPTRSQSYPRTLEYRQNVPRQIWDDDILNDYHWNMSRVTHLYHQRIQEQMLLHFCLHVLWSLSVVAKYGLQELQSRDNQ